MAVAAGEGSPKKIQTIKRDWYQTETHITITILVKNTNKEDVRLAFETDKLELHTQLSDGSSYDLSLNLAYAIVPQQSTYRVTPSMIEVKLKKRDGIRWTTLEKSTVEEPQQIPEVPQVSGPPKYPSSAPVSRDWDRIVCDISKEEGDEKQEGEAALNSLFQKIYSQGSDEVKRAMNKSFQESGGTVLSTNWSEVAREKVEVKAPDGMEWKKWEQ